MKETKQKTSAADDAFSGANSDAASGVYSLASKKDFGDFLLFLRGTEGEKLAQLWLDLDALLGLEADVKANCVRHSEAIIREKYLRVDSPLCLR